MTNPIVLGSCSICGGRVTVPSVWWGIYPPSPSCEQCGAVKADEPVIEMRPPFGYPRTRTTTR